MKKFLLFCLLIFSIGFSSVFAENFNYNFAGKKDVSVGVVKRFVYYVCIDQKITAEQLASLSIKIVEEVKNKEKFNAVAVRLYDYPEFVGYESTLGSITIAPKGKWENAFNVNAGDYSKMSIVYELKEKDWSKRLTKKEAKIWAYFNNLLWTTSLNDNEIYKETAKKFGVTDDEGEEIADKQMTWIYNEKE